MCVFFIYTITIFHPFTTSVFLYAFKKTNSGAQAVSPQKWPGYEARASYMYMFRTDAQPIRLINRMPVEQPVVRMLNPTF